MVAPSRLWKEVVQKYCAYGVVVATLVIVEKVIMVIIEVIITKQMITTAHLPGMIRIIQIDVTMKKNGIIKKIDLKEMTGMMSAMIIIGMIIAIR